MRPIVFRCPPWIYGLLIVGAIAPLRLIPLISTLDWPPVTKWVLVALAIFMLAYALALLPAKLVLSDEGICQTQLFSELKLGWKDIAEWRYFRVHDTQGFWIRDRTGKKRELKHYLVFGRHRSMRVAAVLRQMGVVGFVDDDA